MLEEYFGPGLSHAMICARKDCSLELCWRLKFLIGHVPSCEIRSSGGCSSCKLYWEIVQLHAKKCKQEKCIISGCHDFRPVRKSLVRTALQAVGLSLIVRHSCSKEESMEDLDSNSSECEDETKFDE